jgi:tetratricopeptide (TPR) repeat protein
MLAQFNNTLLAAAKDSKEKTALQQDSQRYLDAADKLSPKRQEIYATRSQMYFAAGDFESMGNTAKACIAIDPSAADCYWYLGLSQLFLNDQAAGQANIDEAKDKGYDYQNTASLSQLAIIYTQQKNYPQLIWTYHQLLQIDSENINYRATLAFIYRETGDYVHAREQALLIIKEHPEAKSEVDDFLSTLPK